jgi:hypothetical protein
LVANGCIVNPNVFHVGRGGIVLLGLEVGARRMSIMISELGNYNGLIFNLIDNAMLIGDSTGPITREAMLQRFRFPDAFVWHPFNVTD